MGVQIHFFERELHIPIVIIVIEVITPVMHG